LRGAYGVFSVQDFCAVGATREVQQGKNLADAAKQAGVEHFVYSSVGGAERNSGIDHWESKWEIEKHIRKLGSAYQQPCSGRLRSWTIITSTRSRSRC
jgi:uncharacterized protein YbjT (DUF2867 family)